MDVPFKSEDISVAFFCIHMVTKDMVHSMDCIGYLGMNMLNAHKWFHHAKTLDVSPLPQEKAQAQPATF